MEEGSLLSPLGWGWLCFNERKNGPLIVLLQFQGPGLQNQVSHYNTNNQRKMKIHNTVTRDLLTGWSHGDSPCGQRQASGGKGPKGIHSRGS